VNQRIDVNKNVEEIMYIQNLILILYDQIILCKKIV